MIAPFKSVPVLLLLLLCLIECKIHTHNPLFILLLLFERPFLNNIQDLKGKEIDFPFSYLRVRQLLAVAEILELSRGSAAVGGVDYKSKKKVLVCLVPAVINRPQTSDSARPPGGAGGGNRKISRRNGNVEVTS